jgi:cysteine synthase A
MRLSNHVGSTPLIKLGDKLYAKAELMNPTGSIKDRPATFILNHAEKFDLIKHGDTIIEASSGNMGISFAWLAAERGYQCKIVMPSNMSEERKKTLRYYGAEVIEVGPGDFDGAIKLRDELSEKNGWFNPKQFSNQLNVNCHYEKTGPEIIYQVRTDFNYRYPSISAFISGTGTGGTIMGVGRKLRQYISELKLVAVEPAESPVMSGGEPGIHGIQGIGDGSKFLVNMDEIDEVITISTQQAKEKAVKIAYEHGLFVGISAAANVLAAERWIEKNNPENPVITILCDRGDRYYSSLDELNLI